MTKIDFYLLKGSGQNVREVMACKLIDKIHKLNHKVYVHTNSQQDAQRIDNLLWTLKAGSFIPHNIVPPGEDSKAAITIGYHDEAPLVNDVLINLTHEIPLFFSQFNRVAEFVDTDDTHRNLGRTRFKFYKDRGYELDSHEMTN